METLRVCLLKVMPAKGDLAGNMEELERVVEQIADCGIDVLITPEGYLDGYVATEDHVTAANIDRHGVQVGGEYLERTAQIAAKRKAWLVFECIHNTLEGPKNAALLFDRQGRIVAHCQRSNRLLVASG